MQVIAKRRIGGAIVWLVFGVLSAVFGAVTLATGLGTMSDLAKKNCRRFVCRFGRRFDNCDACKVARQTC